MAKTSGGVTPAIWVAILNYDRAKWSWGDHHFIISSFSGKSVNLLDYFGQLTLEVILSAAFGVKENIQQSPDNQILLKAKGVFRIPSFVRALNRLPFGGVILRILLWFRGNSNFLVNIASSIIADRRRGSKSARKDLMQLMLTAHGDKTVQGIPKLTDDEIVAQSVIFLLAGYETSSNTLAVTAHNLAIHPEVQEKLRQDIKNVFDNSPDADLYDVVQNLDYLDCVINESLRLFPPAFQMNRKCLEACDINGVHFPAGIEVIIPFYSIHRDPVAWPEPEKFDPERFRSPAKESRHPLHFMPFGSGPRTCIGMRFAQMEVKTTLVGILRKYRLVRCPETQHPLPMLAGATLTPRDGVFVRVEKLRWIAFPVTFEEHHGKIFTVLILNRSRAGSLNACRRAQLS